MSTEQPKEPLRPARRKSKKEPMDWAKKGVGLDVATHQALGKSAQKLGISKADYARAAINYFTQSGLDPTGNLPLNLTSVSTKVGEGTASVRKLNIDIGNRLVSIMRVWEKALYQFLQVQQNGTIEYLEQIEHNLLQRQVTVESRIYATLIEQVMKGGVDSHMSRIMGERIMLKLAGAPDAQWAEQTRALDTERDQQLVKGIRELLTTTTLPTPKLTKKPVIAKPPAPPAPSAAKPPTTVAPSAASQ